MESAMTEVFNDSLNDLFDGPRTVRVEVPPNVAPLRVPGQPPEGFVPWEDRVANTYDEPCARCRGRGRFISHSGRDVGPCFTCKGEGKRSFKSSREQRDHAFVARRERGERRAAGNVEAYRSEHPAEVAWIQGNPGFDFAVSLLGTLAKYGTLTEKQLAAVQRCMARDAARAEARERVRAANDSVPPVDAIRLLET